jgi:hypothetical protein
MDQSNRLKVSKAELIATFSEIDEKINDLHQRSSADFMQLNTHLKDYHNKGRIISENAFRILDTIAGKKNIDLLGELEKIHERLEESRAKIEEEEFRKIQVLKDIMQKSNQLKIDLRNFKQDFITFKFLSSNYFLISNYAEFDVEWSNSLEIWNTQILSIQQVLTSISNHVDTFKDQIAANILHIESRVEKSLKVFQNLSKETKINIGSVMTKSQESILQFPVLKEKTAKSSKSISNIITHLQYHDIIRQKIEHIQKAHYKIIEDLNESIERKKNYLESIDDDYLRIGDIADLQAAQLLLVSKEYQNALNIITGNFQSIANDLTIISNISNEFSYKDDFSEITLLKQIKNQLNEGIILLDLNNFRELNAEYTSARQKLDDISNEINRDIQTMMNKLTKFRSPENENPENDLTRTNVLSRIISLAEDIEAKNGNICENINDIRNLSISIITSDEIVSWGSQMEQDRIHLMVNISRILDALDKDNEELDNVLIENKELNYNILEKIENVINKVDYYDYFEKIVEQVISQLNSINYRLKPNAADKSLENKALNLQEIKTSYTMESERDVHDRVVSGSDISDTTPAPHKVDEIEFF